MARTRRSRTRQNRAEHQDRNRARCEPAPAILSSGQSVRQRSKIAQGMRDVSRLSRQRIRLRRLTASRESIWSDRQLSSLDHQGSIVSGATALLHGRDQASLRSSRSKALAIIWVDFLRFCFALSLGSSESSASNISISGIGVSLRRFNSWSCSASWSSVIRAFSHPADASGYPDNIADSAFSSACRLGLLRSHLGQDLVSDPFH